MICDHCGQDTGVAYGTMALPSSGEQKSRRIVRLCHTGDAARPDCYRRVTVYHESLGILKGADFPSGVNAIRDPMMERLNEWSEIQKELTALFPDKTMVCVTHRRFVPCRKTDGTCVFSTADYDVNEVRKYQGGKNKY